MKQATLSLLLIASSLLGVKEEKNPDFTCKTGKLIIQNDEPNLLAIYINMGTEKSSYKQLKSGESTTFETDEYNERITLELKIFTNTRKVVLEGNALKEDPATTLPVSFLYGK